jgi:large subunit ribosomal protein L9
MKIVLRSDVPNLGHKGDLLEVADGYARNFLVPRGLAIAATKGVVKQAEAMQRARAVRDVRERQGAQATAQQLTAKRVTITARAGEGGRLFGSVTASDIADAVAAQTSIELDRRKLHLEEPIKSLGVHELSIRLHPEVEATLTVEVVAD